MKDYSHLIGKKISCISPRWPNYPLVISWDYKTSDGMKVLTYEEAENACLDKLIELVKQQ